jgi:hypothetical protein
VKRKNIIILTCSILLLISERVLEVFNFPTSWTNTLLQGLIFITSLILLGWLNMKLRNKLIMIVGIILLNYLTGFIPTFKFSTNIYITEKSDYFSKAISTLKPIENYRFVIYNQLRTENIEDCDTSLVDYAIIEELIQNTAVIEIYNNKDATLFAFDRFIDNGYGLLNIRNENVKNLIENTRYKIVGLELRNLVELKNGWYYVSFT